MTHVIQFFVHLQWKGKYNPKFARMQWKLPRFAKFLDLYKNRNHMHATPMFFGSTIKIGSLIQPTRAINLLNWPGIYAYN
jgi:hypothetical protein